MASPVVAFSHPTPQRWLREGIPADWEPLIQARLRQIQQVGPSPQPTVLVAEQEPLRFLVGVVAASRVGCPLVLGNPQWAEAEWQQVLALIHPDLIWGSAVSPGLSNSQPADLRSPHPLQPGWILIPTGGSSGHLRFAIHTWETLLASVEGFQQHFQCDRIHTCCVLPLYHVSGFMQWVRSRVSEGEFVPWPYKALENHQFPDLDPARFFLSLVPTQLQRLLGSSVSRAWLSQFHTILLGGAPPWPALLEQARHQSLRLALTYGMTETASQVVALRPEAFLRGHDHAGQVLPHAQVVVGDRPDQPYPPHQVGVIHLQARSLCRGYYPPAVGTGAEPGNDFFTTDDVGYVDEQGELHIVGRHSQKIITGGENVYPAEVEAAIRATGLVQDVCVVGMPHGEWGEAIAAAYVPGQDGVTEERLKQAIAPRLSRFKHPKYWMAQPSLPRNAQGKINLQQVKGAIARWVELSSRGGR